MTLADILTLCGGLGLFLFGMKHFIVDDLFRQAQCDIYQHKTSLSKTYDQCRPAKSL